MMTEIRIILVRCLILVFFPLFATIAQCIEMSATIVSDELMVTVDDINYPYAIKDNELSSGLPNNISLILSISQQNKKIFVIKLNYQITYDLWDEIYTVRITDSVGGNSTQLFKYHGELMAYITQIKLNSSMAVTRLQDGITYQLSGQVLVNPVKTERIDKIRTWIASSQGYDIDLNASKHTVVSVSSAPSAPSSSTKVDAKKIINQGARLEKIGSARPRFQKLFDKILEQYMTADKVPALWHSQIVTLDISLTSQLSEK